MINQTLKIHTEHKNLILRFLKSNILSTISTVNNKTLKPESALVAFAELKNLEILLLTLKGSRKYTNLLENNKVAMVVGWNNNPKKRATLQYEGSAFPISASEEPKYKEIFLNKKGTPCTKEFFKEDMELFKIVPTWIGFSRFPQGKKPIVIELNYSKKSTKLYTLASK